MGSMMIDGRRVEFTDEPNVLAVIRKAGIATILNYPFRGHAVFVL